MEMISALLKVSLRQQAIYIPNEKRPFIPKPMEEKAANFVAELLSLGYQVSEELLQALRAIPGEVKEKVRDIIAETNGGRKVWLPLINSWEMVIYDKPEDHIAIVFAQSFRSMTSTPLKCGHFIPDGTFPLEHYNGCPYCSKPFELDASKLKKPTRPRICLQLWTLEDAKAYLSQLLQTKTPLDATQTDSLLVLLDIFPKPDTLPE